MHQTLNAIQAERSLAVQRLLRQQAERAGRTYRTALVGAARALAVVQAHALQLQALEPRGTGAGSRQGFAAFSGGLLEGLPAFRELQAFADCPGGVLSIALSPIAARRTGAQEVVDLVAVQQELAAQLSADGVLG